MTPKLTKQEAAKVQSIEVVLHDVHAKVRALKMELTPSDGLVWNPSFKKLLRSQEIMINQMQRMNSAIEKLKKDARR